MKSAIRLLGILSLMKIGERKSVSCCWDELNYISAGTARLLDNTAAKKASVEVLAVCHVMEGAVRHLIISMRQ